MLFIQCVRRFYETHFIQIFSSASKIHLTHYIVGYFHYFGAFLAILSQADGFVTSSTSIVGLSTLSLHEIGPLKWMAMGVFLYAWYHQFVSNLILANLRRNDAGMSFCSY